MSKSVTSAVLASLRSLVVMAAMAGLGLFGWMLHTIDDIEIRGAAIMDMSPMDESERGQWRGFFSAAMDSKSRIWIAIATNCFVSLSALFAFCSLKADRLRVSRYLLAALDLASLLAMAGGFVASLSFAIHLAPSCSVSELSTTPALEAGRMLCPASKASSIAAGVGLLLLTCTCTATLIDAHRRWRQKRSCSFEPTASALGMGHGYLAVKPPLQGGAVPTLYDPAKPAPESPSYAHVLPRDGKRGPSSKEWRVIRRDSGLSDVDGKGDREISGPLGLQRPEKVALMRPARPWSELPRRG